MAYLYEKYKKEVVPAMMKQFNYRNEMEVPRLEKVVVNCGFGRLFREKPRMSKKRSRKRLPRFDANLRPEGGGDPSAKFNFQL